MGAWCYGKCFVSFVPTMCMCVCVSDCIAHMFRKSTVSNLWLAIYWRYNGTGGMSEPKQFLPVKHLTARHWICEHTNEEIFSDKAKCIAKFFDFRLNVTHILRSVHSDAMLFLCAFRILFFRFSPVLAADAVVIFWGSDAAFGVGLSDITEGEK